MFKFNRDLQSSVKKFKSASSPADEPNRPSTRSSSGQHQVETENETQLEIEPQSVEFEPKHEHETQSEIVPQRVEIEHQPQMQAQNP